MNQISVSVIIPIYNVDKYLRDCLDSVINQSLREIEIICIDDGSRDNSHAIIKEYMLRDNRIHLIDYHKNMGQAYARNRGLEIAEGQYVYFVDADDMLKKDTLSILYNIASEEMLDGILFSVECISENGYEKYVNNIKRVKTDKYICNGEHMFASLLTNREYSSGVWSQFWNRDYLNTNEICFREDTSPHEDIWFTVHALLSAKKLKCISDCLYIYRKRENATTTSSMNEKKAMAIFVCYGEAMKYFQKNVNSFSDEGMKAIEIFSRQYRNYARDSFRQAILQGMDINKIEFPDREFEFIFHSFILGRYSFISDFLPSMLFERIKATKNVIVYGAGKIGKEVVQQLDEYGITHYYVAVTKKKKEHEKLLGREVYEIVELKDIRNECIVLISARVCYQDEMIQCLNKYGFTNFVLMV